MDLIKTIQNIYKLLSNIEYCIELYGNIHRGILYSICEDILFMMKVINLEDESYLHYKINDIYENTDKYVICKYLDVPLLPHSTCIFEQDIDEKYEFISMSEGKMCMDRSINSKLKNKHQMMYVYIKPYIQIKRICEDPHISSIEIKRIIKLSKKFMDKIEHELYKLYKLYKSEKCKDISTLILPIKN